MHVDTASASVRLQVVVYRCVWMSHVECVSQQVIYRKTDKQTNRIRSTDT